MEKIYTALGLMSGTSMDGVDASIIQTDGKSKYKAILDRYFKYPEKIYNDLTSLRDKIKTLKDLKKYQKKIKIVEKDITFFHAESVDKILKKTRLDVDFIGFHGQTIFHNPELKISKQLGDGKLLSKLTKKKVVYDFRQKDLKNNGQGAPLTPVFHQLLNKKLKNQIKTEAIFFVNIGGIINITNFSNAFKNEILLAGDIGPGMCLIDKLVRDNLDQRYDENGKIAKSGNVNKSKLIKFQKKLKDSGAGNLRERITFDNNIPSEVWYFRSLDIKEFDLSIIKGLTLKDAVATLTEFTSLIIGKLHTIGCLRTTLILCGGGRKNKFLVQRVKKISNYLDTPYTSNVKLIDDYGIDGDFIESQAFGYLAIRSYLGLPISFPNTTGCKEPTTGGVIVKNY
ncbi:anhydro-N-acetylmuramic acid kinase [Candidatus Pelagibacter sp.]|nr:anhydro-N-acetylmuramic acid kinase [Candidatus Pelagibacter sp.]